MTAGSDLALTRDVHWRQALEHRAWLGVIGVMLCTGGVIWLARTGIDPRALLHGTDQRANRPLGWLLLPGLVAIGIWARGVWRVRALTEAGERATADLTFQERLVWRLPRTLLVGYAFVDHLGTRRHARQRVRAASPLGQQIFRGATQFAVAYDPDGPGRWLFDPNAGPPRERGQ
ncbi:MAG: hypothetical protein AAF628_20260 [Planctomycetota bacterium]